MKNNREYRSMELSVPAETEYRVEGYASTFDEYTLLTVDGIDYKERIEPKAFEGADMSDVVFRINHEGPVYARTSAGSVELFVDEHGLGNRTDLSRTQRSRDLYEEIKAGNYPKMSFAFTVAEDHYDKANHVRIIDRISKVFDISPVTFPANPGTELSARDYFDGVIEAEKAERLERERQEQEKRKLQLKIKIGGYLNGDQ